MNKFVIGIIDTINGAEYGEEIITNLNIEEIKKAIKDGEIDYIDCYNTEINFYIGDNLCSIYLEEVGGEHSQEYCRFNGEKILIRIEDHSIQVS